MHDGPRAGRWILPAAPVLIALSTLAGAAIVALLAIPLFAWLLRRDLGRYRAALARVAP